ncbi:hypothetical protein AWJ20_1299 [Sugiyamaella lignohabitans]|uniref:Uncharacterized protein n=1 Tax=Sugiyamaella lignohabitans TaxID=796027 RepID=A0A167DKR1_9ASCO|nr:uncharacterized protein AWJ20_1299 [Sugiyamaella lignohabitans]ANB13021.1 hypothetical protein AWJ20_1299 [Sugiyamaella lignohabitans]
MSTNQSQTPSIGLSRTALQEISPNKANGINSRLQHLKGDTKKQISIASPKTSFSKISKYPSGSGSPFSISAYHDNIKTHNNSLTASLPWSRRSTTVISTNSFTVFPDTENANSLQSTTSSTQTKTASSASQSQAEDEKVDDDMPSDCSSSNSFDSDAFRNHADKLRSRLRLAYYKVLTNQTSLSLTQMAMAQNTVIRNDNSKNLPTYTPMKKGKVINLRTPIAEIKLKTESTKGTPSPMKAAKSLLRLGNF